MERRVREHDAKPRAEAEFWESIPVLLGEQDDGAGGTGEKLFFFWRDPADAPDRFRRAAHQRQRLFCPVFSGTKPFYCSGI